VGPPRASQSGSPRGKAPRLKLDRLKGTDLASTLNRNDVSNILLGVLRGIHQDQSITEFSRFGIELMVDPFARATLYPAPITEEIKKRGCFFKIFGPSDCQRAQDVEDIVTAAWNDVKSSQITLALAAARVAGTVPPATVAGPTVVVIEADDEKDEDEEDEQSGTERERTPPRREKKRKNKRK
jgi:hypothetical protein